jgi:NADH dehydrogenase
VLIGGGFGGLAAAQALADSPVRITLIDRRNHHLFQPLLYQVATAALNASDIARPIRRILRHQANCEVILGQVESIDRLARKVVLDEGEIAYDYLIVASGATHSYFGHDAWEHDAPGLKTIEDALEIRRRVLVAYEAAERESDSEIVHEWMTFVIVGGGPTGAELAGALAEISRRVLARDFRRVDPKRARIILIEGTPRVLPALTPKSSASAQRQLERLGVEVITSAMVTGIDDRGVTHVGGLIPTRTVIWAAGVAASSLGKSLGVPLDRVGRVIVNPDLSVPGAPEVFVIGDLALILGSDGRPVPGLAPAAMQEGRHAARNVIRAIRGERLKPFGYIDKGTLATIGRGAAVAEIGRLRLSGFLAWMAWLFIHIFYLIGFRNRFMVLAGWAWVYLRNESGARLITGDIEPLLERGEPERRKQRTILS